MISERASRRRRAFPKDFDAAFERRAYFVQLGFSEPGCFSVRISRLPLVHAFRLSHSLSSRHRVTCAEPGEPISILSSPLALTFSFSTIAGQSLTFRFAISFPNPFQSISEPIEVASAKTVAVLRRLLVISRDVSMARIKPARRRRARDHHDRQNYSKISSHPCSPFSLSSFARHVRQAPGTS